MKYFILENHSSEVLEVITEKTLAKFGIVLKSEDIRFLEESEEARGIDIFGWGTLNSYSIEKVKEYREYYKAEGWEYIENICL